MPRLRFDQTLLLITFCLSFLIGLALARRIDLASLPISLIAIVVALIYVPQRSLLSLVLAIIAGLLIGLWRGQTYMLFGRQYQQLFGQKITLLATADNDAIYGKQSQLSFDVVNIETSHRQKLVGKIKVEGLGVPMVYRSDRLQIDGSMSATRGSAQARMSFAKLHRLKSGHSLIDGFRRKFIAGLQSALPEPEASFGAGLLIGQRSTIPKNINDQLSVTGLTHLVAVSGYNLTIIIMAARQIFGRGSKFQSTLAAASLMVLFVMVTGLSASIVRAALVSSLSLLAWYYGRQFKPLLLISLAATITAYMNPFYEWSDIGWYLSFLAFFGVLLIGPALAELLSKNGQPKLVGGLLTETISAQLMTLPIIMYIFGRMSVIGLVANVMVVPLVPLAMLVTLVAGLGGLFAQWGGWVAWPARVMLTYMIDITGLFSKLPHAAVQHTISLVSMLLAYLLIIILELILWRLAVRREARNVVQ